MLKKYVWMLRFSPGSTVSGTTLLLGSILMPSPPTGEVGGMQSAFAGSPIAILMGLAGVILLLYAWFSSSD